MTEFDRDPANADAARDRFAERLRALAPAAPPLDRAAVLAAADPVKASAASPASARAWRVAAAAGWATAAGLAVAWFLAEPAVRVEERVVVKTIVEPAPRSPSPLGGAPAEQTGVPPSGDGEPTNFTPVGDDPARLMAWLDSPAGGPLTAAGLRTLPPGWPPPVVAGPPNPSTPRAPRAEPAQPAAPPTAWELSRQWRDGLL